MAKMILFEEFHVSVFLPAALPKTAFASARRTLNGKRFQTRLRDAIADLFRRHLALKSVKFTISR
jgi:hypothetical protein